MASRRSVLVGIAASIAGSGIARATPRRSKSAQPRQTYEELLDARFRAGQAIFPCMTLAHIAGYGARLPEWVELACNARNLDPAELNDQFESLLSSDPARIERSLLSTDRPDWLSGQNQDGAERIDRGLARAFVSPLALLGRGDVLVAIHARSLDRLQARKASALTLRALSTLAEAGDWTSALAVLERARRSSASIPIEPEQEHVLWKYAYLHREVERVMPVLAEAPFATERVADREWMLKIYQIRAGVPGVEVPVISAKEDDMSYLLAVAMQIAALENDPAAAARVKALRAVLSSQPRQTVVHDRLTLQFNLGVVSLAQARAAIAARRKDYARAAALAKMPAKDGADPPHHVATAFLEEGDWRGAAAVARAHDPRKRTDIAGDPAVDYVVLHRSMAVAAAWAGDDAAAAEFLGNAQGEYGRLMEKRPGEFHGSHLEWHPLVLAGVAEGRLPRKRIHVLVDAFLA